MLNFFVFCVNIVILTLYHLSEEYFMNDKQPILQTDIEEKNESEKAKKSKKKLLIAIISIVALIALLAMIIEIIEYSNNTKKIIPIEIDYNFYPANYNENIFEDEEYIQLVKDNPMKYYNASTGVTVGIDINKKDKYPQEIQFMIDYIQDIINGDHESYNARFSEDYYKRNDRLNDFTMQKVYDVTITQKDSEAVTDKNTGNNYTKYLILLEYKIYENNGTFRRDIGDGSRKQYFTISDKDGKFLIDFIAIEKVNTQPKT